MSVPIGVMEESAEDSAKFKPETFRRLMGCIAGYPRVLWSGTYSASYIARATTSGSFVRPPAHAEEMYNPSLDGRSDGGSFVIEPR